MSERTRVLLVEDESDIADMLALNLRAEGFDVEIAATGEDGMALFTASPPSLIILDLMLPGTDGLEICRRIRASAEYVPIIILSAKSSETQRVVGLELGADDYLTKPFSMAELVARVHAVMRRMIAAERLAQTRAGIIHHGPLHIDPIAREVRLGDRDIALTSKEFDLLAFFARNAGRAFKRMELLDHVWGRAHEGYEHTVNSHINRLRNKIESDPAKPGYILTVWGVGYRFASPTSQQSVGEQ